MKQKKKKKKKAKGKRRKIIFLLLFIIMYNLLWSINANIKCVQLKKVEQRLEKLIHLRNNYNTQKERKSGNHQSQQDLGSTRGCWLKIYFLFGDEHLENLGFWGVLCKARS